MDLKPLVSEFKANASRRGFPAPHQKSLNLVSALLGFRNPRQALKGLDLEVRVPRVVDVVRLAQAGYIADAANLVLRVRPSLTDLEAREFVSRAVAKSAMLVADYCHASKEVKRNGGSALEAILESANQAAEAR